MIYFTVEVYSKWRGHNYEYLEINRENFLDVLDHLKYLRFFPYEIREIKVKQYAFSEFSKIRTALLNCFSVSFPGNNMCSKPIFTLVDVSRCI